MMQYLNELIVIIVTMLIGGAIVNSILPSIVLLSLKKRLLDPISERKIHTKRTSRLGGLSFFVGVFISLFFAVSLSNIFGIYQYDITNGFLLETCCIFLLYLVGLFDDIVGVKYRNKFIFQILTALFIAISGTCISSLNGIFGIGEIPDFVGIPLTILLIVFITNALNLIDGLDGLASSLSIMALTVYGILFVASGQSLSALISFTTVGVLIPFLYRNLKGVRKRTSTKIIMGDSGSLLIGLVLSIMAIKLWNTASLDVAMISSNYFPIMAFTMLLVPCLDVVRVVLHRIKIGQPLFLPDKNHFHHKAIDLGLTHHQSLAVVLAVNAFFIGVNTLLMNHLSIIYIIAIDVVLWTVLHLVITRRINTKRKK